MPCKYYIREGVPSKLFDSLFTVMKERFSGDEVRAEKEAVRVWSMTRSENFKKWFGDWETEANANDPKLLKEALELVPNIKGIYKLTFANDIKVSLREVAEQVSLGNPVSAKEAFGERMVEIAMELYPNVKMGDTRNPISKVVDENGEPLLVFHHSNKDFEVFKVPELMDAFPTGIFTTTNLEYSKKYGKNAYPLFINLKNPLDVPDGIDQGIIVEIKEFSNKLDGKDGAIGPEWNYPEAMVYAAFDPNQVKSIDNIGYFSTEDDRIKAMSAEFYQNTQGSQRRGGGKDFFYFRTYNPEALRSGKKNMSIRPENLKTGIYKYGEDYYKITNRGLKKISELKDTPANIRKRSIGEEDIRFFHIEEFFNNKRPMYVYDIKKQDEKDYDTLAMSAEFMGPINIDNSKGKFATDNDVFNKYTTAISEHISTLQAERRRQKGNLKAVQDLTDRIKEQEEVLAALQANKSVRFLIETGVAQMEDIKQYAMKENASLTDLTEGIRISLIWSKIGDIVDLVREGKNEQELELIEAARLLQSEATAVATLLMNTQRDKIVSIAREDEIEFGKEFGAWFEDGEFKMRDIDFMSTRAISSAFSSNPLEVMITTLTRARTNKSNEEHYEFLKDADETTKRLLGNKNADTRFMTEEIEIDVEDGQTGIISKQKRQAIVSVYARSFYDEYNKLRGIAITENNKKGWKAFYAFEQKHFSYKLTDEGKAEFERYMESIKPDYVTDFINDEYVYDEEAMEKVRKKWDPAGFQAHLDNPEVEANSGARWYTKTPKDIPLNANYERLTPAQKEYHKWFGDQYMDAYVNSIFDYRVGQTDIDQLLMDFQTTITEGLASKAKYIGQAGIDFVKDSFYVVAGRTTSKTVTRPLTGNEHIAPEFKPIDTFLPENGGKMNPLEVLKKFKAASIAYKHKREIEEILNVINDNALIATKQEQNNAGTDIGRSTGGGLGTKNPLQVARRIAFTVKDYLTGDAKDKNTTWSKGVTPGTKGFSIGQTFDSINALTRFRYMALSPLSAAGNFLMGTMNNLTYAASGRYFTDMELARASIMLKGAPFSFFAKNLTLDKVNLQTKEAKLVAEIMYRYNILGDVTEELTYGGQALARFFALQKGGEFLVQGATCLAQMMHTKIDFKDGSKKTMLDLYTLNDEGRLVFQEDLLPDDSPYRNIDNIYKFFDKVKAVNDKIHGDYRQALLGKKDVFGRMLFLFRTWLPMSVKERFGAEYEHKLLGTQKGRYRSFAHLITGLRKDGAWQKDNALNLAKTFLKIIVPVIGRRIKLGGDISEVDRDNINMFVREVHLMMMISMAAGFAKMQVSDDPDDEENNYFRYMYNQGERLNSELSMYFRPSSLNQIMKNVIPLTNTLLDAEKVIEAMGNYISNPEKDIYTRGFRKGDSKLQTRIEQFLPITRSAQSTWSAFSNIYSQRVR